jgi:hypothetical protein
MTENRSGGVLDPQIVLDLLSQNKDFYVGPCGGRGFVGCPTSESPACDTCFAANLAANGLLSVLRGQDTNWQQDPSITNWRPGPKFEAQFSKSDRVVTLTVQPNNLLNDPRALQIRIRHR